MIFNKSSVIWVSRQIFVSLDVRVIFCDATFWVGNRARIRSGFVPNSIPEGYSLFYNWNDEVVDKFFSVIGWILPNICVLIFSLLCCSVPHIQNKEGYTVTVANNVQNCRTEINSHEHDIAVIHVLLSHFRYTSGWREALYSLDHFMIRLTRVWRWLVKIFFGFVLNSKKKNDTIGVRA